MGLWRVLSSDQGRFAARGDSEVVLRVRNNRCRMSVLGFVRKPQEAKDLDDLGYIFMYVM